MTTFSFEDVFAVVRLIPKGRVTTYGAIAAYLGVRSAAQAVGWAIIAAHKERNIPTHRVLNKSGLLTGTHHYPTASAMQELLEQEGISVVDGQVEHFAELFWDPSVELDTIE